MLTRHHLRSAKESSRRAHAAGLGRVIVLLGAVWALALGVGAHRARAQVGEVFLGLGADVLRYARARSESPMHSLRINGAHFAVTSGMSDDSVDAVLDSFEAQCRRRDGGLGPRARAAHPGVELPASLVDGTLREANDERGFVACLDLGDDRVEAEHALASLARFAETHDLADVGAIHGAFVSRSAEGTHFVTLASEGALDLDDFVPASGDAPGVDMGALPRPLGARRVLSAWEDDEPYGLSLYAGANGALDEVLAEYRSALVARGYHVLEADDRDADARTIVAEGPEGMLLVSVARDSNSDSTQVSVASVEASSRRGVER